MWRMTLFILFFAVLVANFEFAGFAPKQKYTDWTVSTEMVRTAKSWPRKNQSEHRDLPDWVCHIIIIIIILSIFIFTSTVNDKRIMIPVECMSTTKLKYQVLKAMIWYMKYFIWWNISSYEIFHMIWQMKYFIYHFKTQIFCRFFFSFEQKKKVAFHGVHWKKSSAKAKD